MKKIVIGFPIDYNNWGYSEIRSLSDHEKHEYALADESIIIYDCLSDWFDDLNTDLIDTETMYWFVVNC